MTHVTKGILAVTLFWSYWVVVFLKPVILLITVGVVAVLGVSTIIYEGFTDDDDEGSW